MWQLTSVLDSYVKSVQYLRLISFIWRSASDVCKIWGWFHYVMVAWCLQYLRLISLFDDYMIFAIFEADFIIWQLHDINNIQDWFHYLMVAWYLQYSRLVSFIWWSACDICNIQGWFHYLMITWYLQYLWLASLLLLIRLLMLQRKWWLHKCVYSISSWFQTFWLHNICNSWGKISSLISFMFLPSHHWIQDPVNLQFFYFSCLLLSWYIWLMCSMVVSICCPLHLWWCHSLLPASCKLPAKQQIMSQRKNVKSFHSSSLFAVKHLQQNLSDNLCTWLYIVTVLPFFSVVI